MWVIQTKEIKPTWKIKANPSFVLKHRIPLHFPKFSNGEKMRGQHTSQEEYQSMQLRI